MEAEGAFSDTSCIGAVPFHHTAHGGVGDDLVRARVRYRPVLVLPALHQPAFARALDGLQGVVPVFHEIRAHVIQRWDVRRVGDVGERGV